MNGYLIRYVAFCGGGQATRPTVCNLVAAVCCNFMLLTVRPTDANGTDIKIRHCIAAWPMQKYMRVKIGTNIDFNAVL